jgi:hypothetical protein
MQRLYSASHQPRTGIALMGQCWVDLPQPDTLFQLMSATSHDLSALFRMRTWKNTVNHKWLHVANNQSLVRGLAHMFKDLLIQRHDALSIRCRYECSCTTRLIRPSFCFVAVVMHIVEVTVFVIAGLRRLACCLLVSTVMGSTL